MEYIDPHPLAAWLRKNQQTHEAFAKKVGVSRQRVGQVLAGSPCGWGLAIQIERATGIKAQRLMRYGRDAA